MNRVFDILALIVIGATATGLATHAETASTIKALGDTFTTSIKTIRG